jgi:hypothetical protein
VITDITRPRVIGGPRTLYVWGHAPLSLHAASTFLARELPRRGFATTAAESEPGEVEARFIGNGHRGGWKVAGVLGCSRKVLLLVAVLLPRAA